ncbi:hypothetical protein [Sphingomonas koreensis]
MSGGGDTSSGFDDWRQTGTSQSGGAAGGGGGGPDKCAIYEKTVIASAVASVVATLKAGDILLVELETAPRNRVVVKTVAGAVVGAVTSLRLVDMIECLKEKFSYQAEVLSISGAKVEIEIRPA